MNIDPSRHADSRNVMEAILRYIPGFRGYLEKSYRRESDQLARDWLADRVRACKQDVDRAQRNLLDAGRIDALDDLERVRARLDALESRIRGAFRGYSAVFDFVRVDEQVLDDVYAHDMSLITDADNLAAVVAQLSASDESPQAAAHKLLDQIEAFHRRFDERARILEGMKG